MGDIGQAIRTYVAAQSGVSALVGTRIYPDAMPIAPTYPCVVVAVTSGNKYGKLGGAAGTRAARIQFDCYASTRLAANAVAEAINAALEALQASIRSANGPVTCSDVGVHEVDMSDGDRWDAESPIEGSDLWTRITAIDCRVFYS